MKAHRVSLVNFRGAKHLSLAFSEGVNLLLGDNGAGKSTVLDAMALLLSWAAARLRSSNSGGRRILETDINNNQNFAWLKLECGAGGEKEVSWVLAQPRRGRNGNVVRTDSPYAATVLKNLNDWASQQREQIAESDGKHGLTLFAYYPVHRAVLDIPLRIRKSHSFDLLNAYDDSLTSGANFRSFFEWYRNREDIENEEFREKGHLVEDVQLNAVRTAITCFLPDLSNLSVKRNPLRMEVEKGGDKLRVDQLSDGEKCLLAMVGDLSRRLAIANPEADNPLQGEGIILIDEIDLHLHPSWQRSVVPGLRKTFPNCQFILSTHSPQVYGEVDAYSIHLLSFDEENGLKVSVPEQAFGLDASAILEEHMNAKSRNMDVSIRLETIFNLITEEKFEGAKEQIEELKKILHGDIPELIRAQSLITMLDDRDQT